MCMWTQNICSVFALKVAFFSNLSGIVLWTRPESFSSAYKNVKILFYVKPFWHLRHTCTRSTISVIKLPCEFLKTKCWLCEMPFFTTIQTLSATIIAVSTYPQCWLIGDTNAFSNRLAKSMRWRGATWNKNKIKRSESKLLIQHLIFQLCWAMTTSSS